MNMYIQTLNYVEKYRSIMISVYFVYYMLISFSETTAKMKRYKKVFQVKL